MSRYTPDENEREHLFNSMFECRGEWDSLMGKLLKTLMLNLPTHWTVVDLETPIDLELANKWCSRRGNWSHGITESKHHNTLGMAYAQWAEDTKTLRGVNLSDSPDFRAFCGDQIVAGDIGKCSYHGALEGIESLNSEYPLWVTVVSPERQVLVEFSYNPAVMIGEIRGEALSQLVVG